jgi:hypothetical protein
MNCTARTAPTPSSACADHRAARRRGFGTAARCAAMAASQSKPTRRSRCAAQTADAVHWRHVAVDRRTPRSARAATIDIGQRAAGSPGPDQHRPDRCRPSREYAFGSCGGGSIAGADQILIEDVAVPGTRPSRLAAPYHAQKSRCFRQTGSAIPREASGWHKDVTPGVRCREAPADRPNVGEHVDRGHHTDRRTPAVAVEGIDEAHRDGLAAKPGAWVPGQADTAETAAAMPPSSCAQAGCRRHPPRRRRRAA